MLNMIKKYKWSLLFGSLLSLSPMMIGLFLWNKLPAQIPTHFSTGNVPDGWSDIEDKIRTYPRETERDERAYRRRRGRTVYPVFRKTRNEYPRDRVYKTVVRRPENALVSVPSAFLFIRYYRRFYIFRLSLMFSAARCCPTRA